jgi:hypothetical protein
MIYDEASSDGRRWVNLDASEEAADVGDEPGQPTQSSMPQRMGEAMQPDGV